MNFSLLRLNSKYLTRSADANSIELTVEKRAYLLILQSLDWRIKGSLDYIVSNSSTSGSCQHSWSPLAVPKSQVVKSIQQNNLSLLNLKRSINPNIPWVTSVKWLRQTCKSARFDWFGPGFWHGPCSVAGKNRVFLHGTFTLKLQNLLPPEHLLWKSPNLFSRFIKQMFRETGMEVLPISN